MIYALITGLFIVVVAVILLRNRRQLDGLTGWTALTADNDYGTKVDPDGSFDFPTGDPAVVVTLGTSQRPGAHYITRGCDSLASHLGLRLTYSIALDPGVTLHPSSDPAAPTIGPTLYFQREDDDWSGAGVYDGYRWFATGKATSPIVAGNNLVLEVLFSEKWTGVEHFNSVDNEAAFISALAHAARVGFVFGGGSGYGHGVFATGKARFTLLKFELI